MKLENFLKKDIIVTQIRSSSKLTERQKSMLIGLGLSGIGSHSKLNCSNSILGMIKKTSHLLSISEI